MVGYLDIISFCLIYKYRAEMPTKITSAHMH